MSQRLSPKIDSHVFLLKDPKVDKLRSGRMSAEKFALLVRPEDPYILIGDTIYALTEQEYYALRAGLPMNTASNAAFEAVLEADLSNFSEADRKRVEYVKADLPGCPACRRNKYRDELYRMAKQYNVPFALDDHPFPQRDYPDTAGEVPPLVFALTDHMYTIPKILRKSCMDCVEKHIAQAWVLSNECYLGYPEHLAYVVGHMYEALDELPKELTALKDTLEYCVARMGATREPFVPLGALSGHILRGRMDLDTGADAAPQDNMEDLSLDLTDEMCGELLALPDDMKDKVRQFMETIDFPLGVENSSRMRWKGTMAVVADMICPLAPRTAALLRRRRLVFGEAPECAAQSGYGSYDLVATIKVGGRQPQCTEGQIASGRGQ